MVAIRTPRRTDDGFYVSRVTWTCDARVQIETFEPNAASSFEVAGAGIQLHNLEGDFYVNGCRLLFGEAIEVDSFRHQVRSLTVEAGSEGGVLEICSPCGVSRSHFRDAHDSIATSIPESWLRVSFSTIATIRTPSEGSKNAPIVCVVGCKGVGKNVFARLLTNSVVFLNGEVALVEGDCCNPILGHPGVLTLTEAKTFLAAPGSLDFNLDGSQGECCGLLKALFVGTLPKSNPAFYSSNVTKLVQLWNRIGGLRPVLVINCCSLSKGVGGDLVSNIIHQSHAARVVKLSTVFESGSRSLRSAATAYAHSGRWKDSYCGALQWLMWGLQCILVHSHRKTMSSEKKCASSIATLLGSIVALEKASRRFEAWELVSDSFVQLTPWCLHLADVRVYCGTACSLRPVRATYALVGSIVGLAIIGSEVALPNCLGLGIVRSFNFQSKVLYILTPLASTQLSVVDALVVRDVNLPLAFKMIRKALVPQSPHESCNGLASEGTGAGMIRSRNNLLRISAVKHYLR